MPLSIAIAVKADLVRNGAGRMTMMTIQVMLCSMMSGVRVSGVVSSVSFEFGGVGADGAVGRYVRLCGRRGRGWGRD